MSRIKTPWPFILLIFLGLCVLVFSIFDVVFGWELIIVTLALYTVLIILVILLIFVRVRKKPEAIGTVEEFEKR